MPERQEVMTSQEAAQQEEHPFTHLEDPYPWYDQIRRPPFYSQAFGGWLVSRFEDIRWILERPELFSAKETMSPPQQPPASVLAILAEGYPPVPAVLNRDGASHQRMRSRVETAFLPWLKGKRAVLQAQADALVDAFLEAGQAEVMSQFAQPFSFGVLCALLAIPAGEQSLFRQRSDETLELFAALNAPIPLPEERQMACARAFVQLQHFLGQLAGQRRQIPGDDLISALGRAPAPGEPPLAEEELVAVLVDILLGGYKTTASLIGNGVQLLLLAPGAWQELQAHPEHIPLAVEEVLRYDAPVQAMVRTATQTILLPGTSERIEAETQVLLLFGAANRDPEAFFEANTLRLSRKPNHHLGFGHGVHMCVGAPLARLEGQVALETLLRRLPQLRLAPAQELTHTPTLLYRAYERLEVSWQASPA
jgi:cytochrome P450